MGAETFDHGLAHCPALEERFAAYLEFDGSIRYLSYVTQPTFELHLERDL